MNTPIIKTKEQLDMEAFFRERVKLLKERASPALVKGGALDKIPDPVIMSLMNTVDMMVGSYGPRMVLALMADTAHGLMSAPHMQTPEHQMNLACWRDTLWVIADDKDLYVEIATNLAAEKGDPETDAPTAAELKTATLKNES